MYFFATLVGLVADLKVAQPTEKSGSSQGVVTGCDSGDRGHRVKGHPYTITLDRQFSNYLL
jgi:hypothetical protein